MTSFLRAVALWAAFVLQADSISLKSAPRQSRANLRNPFKRHAPSVLLGQEKALVYSDSAGVVLVRPNAKCGAGNEEMGEFRTAMECSKAVKEAGGKYFIYGKGMSDGKCFLEHAATEQCQAGWESDYDFNFYRIDTVTTPTLVKAGAECLSEEDDMGSQPTLQACKQAVEEHGGKFFIYGQDALAGFCYSEKTSDGTCPEGWQSDLFNFYRIDEVSSAGCASPLVGGVHNPVLLDNQIEGSSYFERKPEFGLGSMSVSRIDSEDQGWVPGNDDTDEWIQWDFGSPKRVTRVQTKGRYNKPGANKTYDNWVTNFTLSYSMNGTYWYHKNQTFIANNDSSTMVESGINPPIYAQFVRLNPGGWHNKIGLKAELLGCAREALWPGGIPPAATMPPTEPPPPTDPPPVPPQIVEADCETMQKAFLVDPPATCTHMQFLDRWQGCACTIPLPANIHPAPDTMFNPFAADIPQDPDMPIPPMPPTVPPPSDPNQPFVAPMMVPECPFASKCAEESFDCVDYASFGFSEANMAKYTPAAGTLNQINCNYILKWDDAFKVPAKIEAFWHLQERYNEVVAHYDKPLTLVCQDGNKTQTWKDYCKEQVDDAGAPCITTWNMLNEGPCISAPPPAGFSPVSTLGQLCPLQCGFSYGNTEWPVPLPKEEER